MKRLIDLTAEDMKKIEKEYYEHNISQKELAKELNISLDNLKLYAKQKKLRWNIDYSTDCGNYRTIRELYIKKTLKQKEICEILNISPRKLRCILEKMNIKKNTRADIGPETGEIIDLQKLRKWSKEHYKVGQTISIKGTEGVIKSIVNNQIVVKKKNYIECYSLSELYCVGAINL